MFPINPRHFFFYRSPNFSQLSKLQVIYAQARRRASSAGPSASEVGAALELFATDVECPAPDNSKRVEGYFRIN